MKSSARSPAEYVAALPPGRREVIKRLRHLLRTSLPKGFKEVMSGGMLAYVVPHSIFPAGYHCDPRRPLPFINLAAQKQYVALYHLGLYDRALLAWLEREWPKHTEAKLDLGKCCLRFRRLDQIPYDLIGELAAKMTPQQWIAVYQRAIARRPQRRR